MTGLEFDLGGVGHSPVCRTVNLVQPCDIECDIVNVNGYAPFPDSVSLFRLTHTLEHVPSQHYVQFLKDLHRKLVSGGCVEVVQTDVGRVLEMVAWKQLPLRVARLPIFSPADRLRENPHHLHYNLWSQDMLVEDFEACGYRTEAFSAGSWPFDQIDELFPQESQRYWGTQIPNLGVRAFK